MVDLFPLSHPGSHRALFGRKVGMMANLWHSQYMASMLVKDVSFVIAYASARAFAPHHADAACVTTRLLS